MSATYRRPAIALAAIHTFAWLIAIAVTPPLADAYLRERGPSVRLTPHGFQFDLRSSDPLLILAERPFGGHHLADTPLLWIGFVLNIPAVLSAAATESWLAEPVGLRAATWLGTGLFFFVSVPQWLYLGWIIAALAHRLRRGPPHVKSHV